MFSSLLEFASPEKIGLSTPRDHLIAKEWRPPASSYLALKIHRILRILLGISQHKAETHRQGRD